MKDIRPIDQRFRWWLERVASREVDTCLKDNDFIYRYDAKLDALVSWDGACFHLSTWNDKKELVATCAYRLNKRALEIFFIDEETGKIDDGEPIWTLHLVELKKKEFDMVEAASFLQ